MTFADMVEELVYMGELEENEEVMLEDYNGCPVDEGVFILEIINIRHLNNNVAMVLVVPEY